MGESESTREKIKSAAVDVFVEKGYAAARMQEIADRAGANKAMIYYYFQSKDALFESIIKETFEGLFSLFNRDEFLIEKDPEKVLTGFVHLHFRYMAEQQQLPIMMARELHSGNPIPQRVLQELFLQHGRNNLGRLAEMLKMAGKMGVLRKVDPQQTLWNIIAMNLFLFIARPVLEVIFPDAFTQEADVLDRREAAIVDLLLYGLMPRK